MAGQNFRRFRLTPPSRAVVRMRYRKAPRPTVRQNTNRALHQQCLFVLRSRYRPARRAGPFSCSAIPTRPYSRRRIRNFSLSLWLVFSIIRLLHPSGTLFSPKSYYLTIFYNLHPSPAPQQKSKTDHTQFMVFKK